MSTAVMTRKLGNRRHHAILLAFLLGIVPAQAEDTARIQGVKIVKQYVRAVGGAHALSQVRTLSVEGSVTGTGEGDSGTYTLDTKFPDRYYSELNVRGKSFIEAYNGKSAWHRDASGNFATMLSPDSVGMQTKAQIANTRLLNLKKNKFTATFLGQAPVGGKDALHVELSTDAGTKQEFFFDPQTHLPLKESDTVGGVTEEILYHDYRPESGVQFARQLELHRGPDTYAVKITNVTVNGRIGERVFDLPFESQVKLPDLKALFKEIEDNQKAIDKAEENYAGTSTEEETEYDGDGRVKKRTVTESTFFYFDGEEIDTIIKKNGQPLSAADEKKEKQKAQKHLEEVKKDQAKKDTKEEKDKAQGKSENDKDKIGIAMFLRSCEFVNPRRERYRGQDVLAFDFEGNPDYKPHNLVERVVQKFVGTIWVDEKAHDVARLEGHFAGDAKIALGLLASVQKGTGFVIEQEFVNNEVWLPTYQEGQIGARVLLLKGYRIRDVTHYSDYKKLPVAPLSAKSPPIPRK